MLCLIMFTTYTFCSLWSVLTPSRRSALFCFLRNVLFSFLISFLFCPVLHSVHVLVLFCYIGFFAMIIVIIIMIVTLKVYGSCEAVLSKRSKKAQPRRCLLSLQVRYMNIMMVMVNLMMMMMIHFTYLCRKNGNDEQCFRAQNILHPPCAQVNHHHHHQRNHRRFIVILKIDYRPLLVEPSVS